ncbi:C-terminal binding protein [Celerinatantimonas diazotrophica]|uniref:D-3-phosphoglycerate dehydrogenase n=1 Tax=Celerinatantimonas diazotrophica TaxID=412034 RepID=A0A4R1JAM7_9GAMM|nr:C-terminal binding protein [Celerinatantimonas diazotrophica]TCK47554.1 D-3-phosphoglycerate dehydrogenase [Celerinatantimonas diazotrophica]CAG9296826.1 Hydroxypyruvate reductase [Celerinatantimonas diazotrophica]
MKVVISDYKASLNFDTNYAVSYLRDTLGSDTKIIIYEFDGNKNELINVLKDADALITGYLEVDKEIIQSLNNLKIISIMATGFNFIDIEQANHSNIGVAVNQEYCTQEVSEHVMSLLLALNRKLKHYTNNVDTKGIFDYGTTNNLIRLDGSTLGIFGLGKIGRAVAKKAQAFGIKVIAYDPFISEELANEYNVKLLTIDEVLSNSDNISINMLLTNENIGFLNMEKFEKMSKRPYIINVSRGALINENDLAEALDKELIKGAGLDVLVSESPVLDNHPLVQRDNVIITPHSAFYSETSILECQRIACDNVVNYLNGSFNKMFRLINTQVLE